jgi:predicted enzyme related to lactoylglutathione lyase/catechol 2,3-dioxygenase-like lactoylglutathione lyase family enzyme
MAARLWSVLFDANDRVALARFWADALGWEYHEEQGYSSVTRGDGTLRRLEFVASSNQKQSKNWMHFDLSSETVEDQHATVERLVALGARRVDIGQGPDDFVLADPEGNEFCVLEPENFTNDGGFLGSLTCDGTPTAGYFWSEVLGWPLVWDQDEETAIRSAEGGQFITFGPPVAPKHAKNRLHIDIAPPKDGDHQAEVERLLSLGARHADIGQGDVPWVVMADPDGNEFCVLTPR